MGWFRSKKTLDVSCKKALGTIDCQVVFFFIFIFTFFVCFSHVHNSTIDLLLFLVAEGFFPSRSVSPYRFFQSRWSESLIFLVRTVSLVPRIESLDVARTGSFPSTSLLWISIAWATKFVSVFFFTGGDSPCHIFMSRFLLWEAA